MKPYYFKKAGAYHSRLTPKLAALLLTVPAVGAFGAATAKYGAEVTPTTLDTGASVVNLLATPGTVTTYGWDYYMVYKTTTVTTAAVIDGVTQTTPGYSGTFLDSSSTLRSFTVGQVVDQTLPYLHRSDEDLTNEDPVLTTYTSFGYDSVTLSGTKITITTTTEWTIVTDAIYVGNTTASNTLTINFGSFLESTIGIVGNTAASGSNKVYITAPSLYSSGVLGVTKNLSQWNVYTPLVVGVLGSSNLVEVSAGGLLNSNTDYVADLSTGATSVGVGSSGNTLSVTGTDGDTVVASRVASQFNFYGDLVVGSSGSTNSLSVAAGAIANGTAYDVKTVTQYSSGNVVSTVTSVVLATDAGNFHNVQTVENTVVDGTGTITTWVPYGNITVGSLATAASNAVTVSGSTLVAPLNLTIGALGDSNSVTIASGSVVSVGGTITINNGVGSALNSLTVSDANTALSVSSIILGNQGNGFVTGSGTDLYDLEISDSATVTGLQSLQIGVGSASDATLGSLNSALISSVGTALLPLTIASNVTVGENGSSNGLDVSAAILTIGNNLVVGVGNTAAIANGGSNAVDIAAASTVTVVNDIIVGQNGSDNSLTIEGGSIVNNVDAAIGGEIDAEGIVPVAGTVVTTPTEIQISLSNNNSAVVTGAASAWNNSGYLIVGNKGSGNSLSVENKASLSTQGFIVGLGLESVGGTSTVLDNSAYGSSNVISVDDATLSALYAYVGYYGSSNSLTVKNGSYFESTYAVIGNYGQSFYDDVTSLVSRRVSSSENSVAVTGAGTEWVNNFYLMVGGYGKNNTLAISDGALVVSGYTLIGYGDVEYDGEGEGEDYATFGGDATAGSGNSVTVEDVGSIFVNYYVMIGYYGSSNSLIVKNGALVVINGELSFASSDNATGNFLKLAGGYVAILGNSVDYVDDILYDGNVLVWQAAAAPVGNITGFYVAGTTENVSVKYVSTDEEGLAITGYDGLAGYTIVSAGDNEANILAWADIYTDATVGPIDANGDGTLDGSWYYSSWYGWFFYDSTDTVNNTSTGFYIYSLVNGWQYVYGAANAEKVSVEIYDFTSGDFWSTSEANYPSIYDYTHGWLLYTSGSGSNRWFYSWNTNTYIQE